MYPICKCARITSRRGGMRKKCVWQNRAARFSRGKKKRREESTKSRSRSLFPPTVPKSEPNYTTNLMNEWASKYSGSYKPWAYINHGQCRVAAFVERSKRASLALALCGINSRYHWRVNAREYATLGSPHGLKITTFLSGVLVRRESFQSVPIFRNWARIWMAYVETWTRLTWRNWHV